MSDDVTEETIRRHIESDTTPATMSLHEAIAGARLLMDFTPEGATPTKYIALPREAVAALLKGVANAVVFSDKWHKAENFILNETGYSKHEDAAAYLKRLRLRAGGP